MGRISGTYLRSSRQNSDKFSTPKDSWGQKLCRDSVCWSCWAGEITTLLSPTRHLSIFVILTLLASCCRLFNNFAWWFFRLLFLNYYQNLKILSFHQQSHFVYSSQSPQYLVKHKGILVYDKVPITAGNCSTRYIRFVHRDSLHSSTFNVCIQQAAACLIWLYLNYKWVWFYILQTPS